MRAEPPLFSSWSRGRKRRLYLNRITPLKPPQLLPVSKLSGALWRRDEKRKESLQLSLWNLNICIEKVDAKCWLAEMTLVMTSLLLARVFQCLFTFALVSASRWLVETWQHSRRGAAGEMEVEFKFWRRSCMLSLLFPPPPPPTRAPWTPCSQATVTWTSGL